MCFRGAAEKRLQGLPCAFLTRQLCSLFRLCYAACLPSHLSSPRAPPCLYPAAARLCCLSALELFPCLLSPTPVLSSSSEGSQYVAACCCLLISLLYSIQFNGLSCVAVGSENRPKLVINSPAAWGREGGFGKHLHFPSWRWDTCRQGNRGGGSPLCIHVWWRVLRWLGGQEGWWGEGRGGGEQLTPSTSTLEASQLGASPAGEVLPWRAFMLRPGFQRPHAAAGGDRWPAVIVPAGVEIYFQLMQSPAAYTMPVMQKRPSEVPE